MKRKGFKVFINKKNCISLMYVVLHKNCFEYLIVATKYPSKLCTSKI